MTGRAGDFSKLFWMDEASHPGQDAASSSLPSEVCSEVQREMGIVKGNAVFYRNLHSLGLSVLMT